MKNPTDKTPGEGTPRTCPPWCAGTHRPDPAGIVHHVARVAAFEAVDGSDVEVVLVHAERPDGRSLDPHLVVRRSAGQRSTQLDLTRGEALTLAELFTALDPTEFVRFAAAVAQAATALDDDDPEVRP